MNIAKEDCYLALDKKTVVKEGDERAAFLFARKGQGKSDAELVKVTGSKSFFGAGEAAPAPEPTAHKRVAPEPVTPPPRKPNIVNRKK